MELKDNFKCVVNIRVMVIFTVKSMRYYGLQALLMCCIERFNMVAHMANVRFRMMSAHESS